MTPVCPPSTCPKPSYAENVVAEVQPTTVTVTWTEHKEDDPLPGDVATWVLQDILHPSAPLQVVPGDVFVATVVSPRCEWSAYVLYKVVVRVGVDGALRSQLSLPSPAIYVSCDPPRVCYPCTRSVTFSRHSPPQRPAP